MRESPLFPLFHGAEEVAGPGIVRDAPVPVEKLALETPGELFGCRVGRCVESHALGRRREREVDQSRQGGLGQAARAARFFGDGVETCDGVIVDGVEQQEVLALRREVLAQIVFEQHVEHRPLTDLRLACRGDDERRIPVLEDHPVDHQGRGGPARSLREIGLGDQIVHRPLGHGQVQFRRQLRTNEGVGFAIEMFRREQLAAFVGEALAQQRPERGIARDRPEQGARLANLVHANQGSDLRVVRQIVFQGAEVARRGGLPAVVEVHADIAQQGRAGFPVVLCRLAQEQSREAAALITEGLFPRDVVLPRTRQHIVVANLIRILHPLQKHPPALARRARRQFAFRQNLLREATVLLLGGGLDAPAAAKITEIAIGNAEHIRILGGVPRHPERPALLYPSQTFGGGEVALQAAPIVIKDVGIVRDERCRPRLYGLNAGDDGQAEVLEGPLLARTVVDDAVDVALAVQLERRQADALRALLPGQVQPTRDAGEALGLDRAEDAVAHR